MSATGIQDVDPAFAELFPEFWPGWLKLLSDCTLCPRKCHADRLLGKSGYCRTGAWCEISSICCHRGEEPPISGERGICNVFFSHCNLQCIYCQNYQISSNCRIDHSWQLSLHNVVDEIVFHLRNGCRNLGFVSSSHQVVQMQAIIRALHERGFRPVVVYNTNGYDTVETLQMIEDLVDVYLPDFKYIDESIARRWSDAADYPLVAKAALKEMFRQKGSTIRFGDDGLAEYGLIIRHLVLPGQVDNSIGVMRFIADELSPRVHVSLMSQYYPTPAVIEHPELGRNIFYKEYRAVRNEMERLGITRGWMQELESQQNYRPDFRCDHPFEFQ